MTVHATIGTRRLPAGRISSDEAANEYRAQKMVDAAIAECISKLQDAAIFTELRKSDIEGIVDDLNNLKPCTTAWDEAISEAQRAD